MTGGGAHVPLDGVIHAIPVIIGGGVSDLHHVLGAPLEMRLILLDWEEGNVAIEVTAARQQHSLMDFSGEPELAQLSTPSNSGRDGVAQRTVAPGGGSPL